MGAAAGGLWAGFGGPAAPPSVALAVVGAAALVDLAGTRGRAAPLAVRRQVPRAWGRIFSPETAATLYGARLGVGPLTVLNTWQWWAAAALATSVGPGAGAATGAAFHLGRIATMQVVASGRPEMVSRMRQVDRWAGPVAVGGSVVVLAVATVLAVMAIDSEPATDTSMPPATTGPPSTAAGPSSTTSPPGSPEATGLAAMLVDAVGPAWARDDDAVDAGPLDLAAAAALEPDTAAERALLETRGFEAGHSRAFVDGDGGVVYVQLYRLASAEQAAFYVADGRETVLGRGAVELVVDSPPGAFGFTQVEDTEGGAFVAHAVSFAIGDLHVLVVAGSPDGSVTAELARDVAVEQAESLDAS